MSLGAQQLKRACQRAVRGSSQLRNRTMASSSSSSSTSAGPSTPVRLVLFDVFDTLCAPRKPVHEQYYEEAVRASLSPDTISPESIKASFRPAFKEMNSIWPFYGKHTEPPTSPDDWWAELMRRCMIHAGADEQKVTDVMPRLGPALLRRFESDEGYEVFPEVLTSLVRLRREGRVKTSVVTNSDPRILRVLDALHISPLLSYPPTLSWDVEISKPDQGIYQAACERCDEQPGEGVMMVGDELKADYEGAMDAGLEARLIRRPDHERTRTADDGGEDLAGVRVIQGINVVVEEVLSRNASALP